MTGRIVWWVLFFCWDIQMVASELKHGSILPLWWWCDVCVWRGFLAVDFKSAAPLRCCHGTMDQNLWGMCPGRCCVFVAKNEGRSEGKRGSTTSKVYLIKWWGECILHMFWTKPVTYIFFFFNFRYKTVSAPGISNILLNSYILFSPHSVGWVKVTLVGLGAPRSVSTDLD